MASAEAQKANGKKGKGGNNEQGKGKGKGQTQSGWKKFDGHCRHGVKHGLMERDCLWKNTDKSKNCHEPSQLDATQLRLSSPPSLPSALLSCSESNRAALCCRECAFRTTDEMLQNRRVHCGRQWAAVSAAPRAFAAHCSLKRGRQLILRLAPGHTPAYHGHRAVPLQL